MRVRLPFAAVFVFLLFVASAGGLLPHWALPNTPTSPVPQTDKFLHVFTFFALTASFYFILDTTRRRVLHFTLFVCTFALGVGSEVIQGLLPNGRDFDPLDVVANVFGSLSALGLASLYHKRSLERRRRARFSVLTGEDLPSDDDLELGESSVRPRSSNEDGYEDQQTGIAPAARKTVEEEVENWDANAEDDPWDVDDETGGERTTGTQHAPASGSVENSSTSKKVSDA